MTKFEKPLIQSVERRNFKKIIALVNNNSSTKKFMYEPCIFFVIVKQLGVDCARFLCQMYMYHFQLFHNYLNLEV